jgi:hypothetical protein
MFQMNNNFNVGVFNITQDFYATFSADVMIIGRKNESRFVNDIYNGYNVLNGFSIDQMYNQLVADNETKNLLLEARNITNNLAATATLAQSISNVLTTQQTEGYMLDPQLWGVFWNLYKNTKFNNDIGSDQYIFYCYKANSVSVVQAAQIP